MNPPPLEKTKRDLAVALTRGVVGGLPWIGGVLAEAIDQLIPNQRMDRAIDWIRRLDEQVGALQTNIDQSQQRLRDPEGLDLFEESLTQATRSVSEERRQYLANILARSLTQNELKYVESKKLLNLFRELMDAEIIMLSFYSEPQTLFSPRLRELADRYPEILRPVSREIGIPQEKIDQAALQDSYRDTLVRLGLLRVGNHVFEVTSLGRLLLHYVFPAAPHVPTPPA